MYTYSGSAENKMIIFVLSSPNADHNYTDNIAGVVKAVITD